jgi:hypothetical protein
MQREMNYRFKRGFLTAKRRSKQSQAGRIFTPLPPRGYDAGRARDARASDPDGSAPGRRGVDWSYNPDTGRQLPVVLSLFLCRPRNLSREVGVGEGRQRKRGDGEEVRRIWLRSRRQEGEGDESPRCI